MFWTGHECGCREGHRHQQRGHPGHGGPRTATCHQTDQVPLLPAQSAPVPVTRVRHPTGNLLSNQFNSKLYRWTSIEIKFLLNSTNVGMLKFH